MIVLSVTNCPSQLRGDLTKWFIEIDVGVYVGKLSARVREKIWDRVCKNIDSGKAIMVFSTNNEQGFQIITHNTEWTPILQEGLWLMQKPENDSSKSISDVQKREMSKASKYLLQNSRPKSRKRDYVIMDVETTGLNAAVDKIIEIGMLKIEDGEIVGEFQVLVNSVEIIPKEIVNLTGITDRIMKAEGVDEKTAICSTAEFAGNSLVVGYNMEFDLEFVNKLCERQNEENFVYRSKDILRLVRRKMVMSDYRLETVAKKCEVDVSGRHRALEDCRILFQIISKLNLF
ncbi:MAG: type I-E CRISPR-associated endoribonuclease Cas2e [Acetatifactor sp.]